RLRRVLDHRTVEPSDIESVHVIDDAVISEQIGADGGVILRDRVENRAADRGALTAGRRLPAASLSSTCRVEARGGEPSDDQDERCGSYRPRSDRHATPRVQTLSPV